MAHECPDCGMECYCDGEDHGQPTPTDCEHECQPDGDDDFDDFEAEMENQYPRQEGER